MESLTGIMIAGFIYFSGFLIAAGEMQINNFFSFLTAMMLAYQPIRSLATINMLFNQGAVGANRVFTILDAQPNIKEINSAENLNIKKGAKAPFFNPFINNNKKFQTIELLVASLNLSRLLLKL